ncbi:hypothetical protein C0Q70_01910 [Pomacea canaliculata]|uniref:BZIP domain-containing protein n=2 Tax=Pomacea canaliculata TaxID=400727 RepID=A0A2T7Q0T1_POMCA|nr:hypothetical protein C0Q70_01910 [Pomacea canaliculata]
MYSEHVQYVTSHPNSEAFTTQTLFSFITSSGDTAKPFSQTRPDSHPSNQKSNKTAHNFVNHHPPPTVTSRKEKAKEMKVAIRKLHNKEAAKKSHLAKKKRKETLLKKSMELYEEKLQLEQDIRTLNNCLRLYHQMYSCMTHVCCLPDEDA